MEPGLHRPLGDDEPTGLRGQLGVQPWAGAADLGVGTHPRSGVLGRPGDAVRPSTAAGFRPRPQPRPRAQAALLVDEHRRCGGTGRAGHGPAAGAWRTTYDGAIAHVDIPFAADDPASDISYPLPAQRAADYFFQVPPAQRPWIAAVQADGRGLVQTSTAQLRGRKLFLWGAAAGGRHWQEWLCGPGSGYLEIQAGLATTQLEHLRLEGAPRSAGRRPTHRSKRRRGRYTVLGRMR